MATSVNMKGQKVIWGTRELGTPVSGGICVNGTLEEDGPDDPVDNEDGQEIGINFYDELWAGDLDVVCKADCKKPKIADEVRAGGYKLFVKNVKQVWANKAKKQLKLTLKGGANI